MIRFACLLLASMLAIAGSASGAYAADPVAVRFGDTGVCGSDKVLIDDTGANTSITLNQSVLNTITTINK